MYLGTELNVPSCKWYDISGHDLLGGGVELIVQSGFRLQEKDNPTSEIKDSSSDSEITGLRLNQQPPDAIMRPISCHEAPDSIISRLL